MKLSYLSKAPLLGELPAPQLEQIAEEMVLHRYSAGDVIFAQGSISQALYVIESGWVRLIAPSGGSLATLGAGSLLGEGELLLRQAHPTDAVAVEPVGVWTLSREGLNRLIATDPELGLKLGRVLGESRSGRGRLRESEPTISLEAPVVRRERTLPVRRPPAARRSPPPARGVTASFDRLADWFGACSTGAKIRFVAIVLLLTWLFGIVIPATLIASLA